MSRSDDVGGILLFCVIGALVLTMLVLYHTGRDSGIEHGRCLERWRYQRTVTDTLATVRSGCALPPDRAQGS